MNQSNDPVLDRIENAERLLRQARAEHVRGTADLAEEFLRAAAGQIAKAIDAAKSAAPVLSMHDPRGKARAESDYCRQEIAHAR